MDQANRTESREQNGCESQRNTIRRGESSEGDGQGIDGTKVQEKEKVSCPSCGNCLEEWEVRVCEGCLIVEETSA